MLRNTPSILNTLQENVRAIRAVLDRIDALAIPSHAASPIVRIYLRSATPSLSAAVAKAAANEPRDPGFARCSVVRYFRRGTRRATGHRGQGARTG
jgi:hypothetical protein